MVLYNYIKLDMDRLKGPRPINFKLLVMIVHCP